MNNNRQPRYWVFKHRPGINASEEECKNFVAEAVTYNYAFMQYEYDYQEQSKVTLNWRLISQIKEGDYLFLRGGDYIYAFGRAIQPRLKPEIKLSISDVIKRRSHDNYVSGKYNGIIHFTDSLVFYENLSKEQDNNWGQRIDVDSWKYYNPNGIGAKSQDLYEPGQNEFGVIKELCPDKGEIIINQLKKSLGMKSDLVNLLLSNHNIILNGAPGTGKTYLAQQIATLMMFGKSNYDELSKVEIEDFYSRFCMVQFHPSYDYTDFVEGLRPKQDESENIGFEPKDGIFKKFCENALLAYLSNADNAPKYVFVIDEINRGEISKIFGELFFSIDSGYRVKKEMIDNHCSCKNPLVTIRTQYSNMCKCPNTFDTALGITNVNDFGHFFVPDNVYIIGTMNDIDRSVESMDFAFRRRFAFKEIKAGENLGMLEGMTDKEKIINRMNNLNAAIEKIEGLSSAYHIGGSYFMKLKLYQKEDNSYDYEALWNNHLKGLLMEYLRGMADVEKKVEELKEHYDLT